MANYFNNKILILSCGTGEGHNSAAGALEEVLREKGITCEVKDVLTFKSERAARRAANVYGTVIKKAPALFGFVYKIGGLYDKCKLPSPVYYANAAYARKLFDFIASNGYSCVICTHLFAMEAMTAVRRKFGNVKCYGVLTDYVAIPFYKDTDLDGYFVADEEVGGQLVKSGIAENRIFISGIPVHPKFKAEISKTEARAMLGISCNKKIVVVTSGGAGCGKILKLCKKLDKLLDCNHLIYVFTGRNAKLKSALDKKYACEKIRTVAFTSDLHLYMKAADVLISKAGGLTCTEAAVANVPMVHLKAIPGQETANMNRFYRDGMSIAAKSVNNAADAAAYLLSDGQCAQAILRLQRLHINAHSAQNIIEKITGIGTNDNISMAAVYSGGVCFGECNVQQDYPETVGA